MFDTRDQILNQLRAGEDGRAEFKDVRLGKRGVIAPNTEELASELVAFANAEGGVVFLSVDDACAVRGIPVERLDTVENWIVNLATNNCDPPIRPILRKDLLPDTAGADRHVLLVEVSRGLYVHRTTGGSTTCESAPRNATSRRRSSPGSSSSGGREYVFDEQ